MEETDAWRRSLGPQGKDRCLEETESTLSTQGLLSTVLHDMYCCLKCTHHLLPVPHP